MPQGCQILCQMVGHHRKNNRTLHLTSYTDSSVAFGPNPARSQVSGVISVIDRTVSDSFFVAVFPISGIPKAGNTKSRGAEAEF